MKFLECCLTCWMILSTVVCASAEQIRWPMVVGMNDVYTQISVLSQREHVGCSECALITHAVEKESFSCHSVNAMCLIHDRCLVKSTLSPGTFSNTLGWRHFCKNIQISSGSVWQDVGPIVSRKWSLRFDVRASQDAYLGLSTGNSTTFTGYWIVLGGWTNTKSCLRHGFVYASTCFNTHNGASLDASEFVKFWVKWDFGNVRVGIGDTLENGQILQYNFSNAYAITNVLVKSSSNMADWMFLL